MDTVSSQEPAPIVLALSIDAKALELNVIKATDEHFRFSPGGSKLSFDEGETWIWVKDLHDYHFTSDNLKAVERAFLKMPIRPAMATQESARDYLMFLSKHCLPVFQANASAATPPVARKSPAVPDFRGSPPPADAPEGSIYENTSVEDEHSARFFVRRSGDWVPMEGHLEDA